MRASFRQLLKLDLTGHHTYVNGNQVDFGVTVLSGFRGGHVNDLARSALYNDMPVLPVEHCHYQDRTRMMIVRTTHLRAEHCIGKVKDAPAPA